jgi:hypothetical protein
MTAAVLARPVRAAIPAPRTSPEAVEPDVPSTPAVAYQRVLHRMVRREFRLLADLATWADPDDAARAGEITRHADLIGRVVLQHHATERELLWPALFGSLPAAEQDGARVALADWTSRAALLDHELRDLSTAARQWAVATTAPARAAFFRAVTRVADAVDAHHGEEEGHLFRLLGAHLTGAQWASVSRAARTKLAGREQLLVLGLTLEDACALDRARLLAGLPRDARTAWRLFGHRNFCAAVVRLRGAPPAR